METMQTLAFVVFSLLAVVSALVTITRRNAVVCALFLAVHLVSIAGLFFTLGAQFIGFLQIIVYAGAIMVLVLFVIMLLSVRDTHGLGESGFFQRWLAPLLALAFATLLIGGITATVRGAAFADPSPGFGTVKVLGRELFSTFFYPFEAISLLLVVAMIGAVLLAKRRL